MKKLNFLLILLLVLPNVMAGANVKITEVWPNPTSLDRENEFFEITNFGDASAIIILGKTGISWGWTTSHSTEDVHMFGDYRPYMGDAGISLKPGESLILTRNKKAFSSRFPNANCKIIDYRSYDVSLNNVEDWIKLYSSRHPLNLIDYVAYSTNGLNDASQSLHFLDVSESFSATSPRTHFEIGEPTPCEAKLACADIDGDGYLDEKCGGTDCNDNDASVWRRLHAYIDNDGDGYGSPILIDVCAGYSLPKGYSENDGDCNDDLAWINPGVNIDIPGDVYDADCNGVIECDPRDYTKKNYGQWLKDLVKGDNALDDLDESNQKNDKEKGSKTKNKNKLDKLLKNHGQYVKCVTQSTTTLVKQGLITKKERANIVKKAARGDFLPLTGFTVLDSKNSSNWQGVLISLLILAFVFIGLKFIKKKKFKHK